MNVFQRIFGVLLLAQGFATFAAEVIPPAPARYFNDYANVVPAAKATSLNATLENFERESSSQIVVAIFTKMQSDSSIEDYTVRVAQAWKVGQKAKDNGAVLFVFIQDREMFLQVGYGLEGVLPDALCKRIIEDEIKPHFRNQNFSGGLSAGVTAILAATKGEYKGTGRTVSEGSRRPGSRNSGSGFSPSTSTLIFFGIMVVMLFLSRKRRKGSFYTSSGWGSSGGGWSSGGGGGGGFSGGGGSFGGGGAGGRW